MRLNRGRRWSVSGPQFGGSPASARSKNARDLCRDEKGQRCLGYEATQKLTECGIETIGDPARGGLPVAILKRHLSCQTARQALRSYLPAWSEPRGWACAGRIPPGSTAICWQGDRLAVARAIG